MYRVELNMQREFHFVTVNKFTATFKIIRMYRVELNTQREFPFVTVVNKLDC
ncbi:hypothetical protein T06_9828 [Trichinella sp. T6]|nr:hypothetical protein T06_9828 [Trichinella sp. T6]